LKIFILLPALISLVSCVQEQEMKVTPAIVVETLVVKEDNSKLISTKESEAGAFIGIIGNRFLKFNNGYVPLNNLDVLLSQKEYEDAEADFHSSHDMTHSMFEYTSMPEMVTVINDTKENLVYFAKTTSSDASLFTIVSIDRTNGVKRVTSFERGQYLVPDDATGASYIKSGDKEFVMFLSNIGSTIVRLSDDEEFGHVVSLVIFKHESEFVTLVGNIVYIPNGNSLQAKAISPYNELVWIDREKIYEDAKPDSIRVVNVGGNEELAVVYETLNGDIKVIKGSNP